MSVLGQASDSDAVRRIIDAAASKTDSNVIVAHDNDGSVMLTCSSKACESCDLSRGRDNLSVVQLSETMFRLVYDSPRGYVMAMTGGYTDAIERVAFWITRHTTLRGAR